MNEPDDYLVERLNSIFQDEVEFGFYYNHISTNVPYWDDEFISCIDVKKCREIFPNFSFRCIVYEYPSEDMISNEKAEELHFSGVEYEMLSKENIDKFCVYFKEVYENYKSLI